MCLAPVLEYLYSVDYWHPNFILAFELDLPNKAVMTFGIESLIFGFTVAGFCGGVFDAYMCKYKHKVVTGITWGTYGRLWLSSILALGVILFLHYVAGLNSVHAHVIGCTALSVGFLWKVRSRWKNGSLVCALANVILMIGFYYGFYLILFPEIIEEWWKEDGLLGPKIGGVPVEEHLWFATNALYIGAAVRYCLDVGFDDDL